MKQEKHDKAFMLSLISIFISITTVILFFVKVSPESVVDSNTYISCLVTILAILFTVLVGYQIYNAMDIKRELKRIDLLKEEIQLTNQKHAEEIQKAQDELKKLTIENKESSCILQARILVDKNNKEFDAIIIFLEAIFYSLSSDHRMLGYKEILDELETYLLKINNLSFSNVYLSTSEEKKENPTYEENVHILKSYVHEESLKIRKHPNYLFIKDRYEELMEKFDTRLDLIAQRKRVSLDELDQEME